jgi:hypothetical protein
MAREVEDVEHLERVGLTPPGVIARLDRNPVSTAGGYWIARSSQAMTA